METNEIILELNKVLEFLIAKHLKSKNKNLEEPLMQKAIEHLMQYQSNLKEKEYLNIDQKFPIDLKITPETYTGEDWDVSTKDPFGDKPIEYCTIVSSPTKTIDELVYLQQKQIIHQDFNENS